MTTIHQMLPNYVKYDAIGNNVTQMRALLREWGYESEVFADLFDERLGARFFGEFASEDKDAWVIYHYSTGSRVNRFVFENSSRIILMYHNITPAEFFEPFDERAARVSRDGRAFLRLFSGRVRFAMAVSPFNAEELEALQIGPTAVVPCVVDFNAKPSSGGKPFDDEKTNILFVGRIAPQKRYEDLLKIFHVYRRYVDTNSRLVLVGGYSPHDRYYRYLKSMIDTMNIPDVVFTGFLPDESMGDYFGAASVFLCMSRHEGFGIPLLEAMNARVPVVALARAGVTGAMGYAGVLVNQSEPHEVAELLGVLKEDAALRERIVATQLRRVQDFSKEKTAEAFRRVITQVIGGGNAR